MELALQDSVVCYIIEVKLPRVVLVASVFLRWEATNTAVQQDESKWDPFEANLRGAS